MLSINPLEEKKKKPINIPFHSHEDSNLNGCPFYHQCSKALDVYKAVKPNPILVEDVWVQCHLYNKHIEEKFNKNPKGDKIANNHNKNNKYTLK